MQVIFVVDAVNTSAERVAYARLHLESFLRRDNGQLSWPMSLVFFTDVQHQMPLGPTRDGNALATLLESEAPRLRELGRSSGVWGAYERAELSLRALNEIAGYESGQPGIKLLIWLSPGWPLVTGLEVNLSNKSEQAVFGNVIALSDEMRDSRITLYCVDPLGIGDASGFRALHLRVVSGNRCGRGSKPSMGTLLCRCSRFKAVAAF